MIYHCVNFPIAENDNIILSSVTSRPHLDVKFTYTQVDNMVEVYAAGVLATRSYEMAYAVMNDVFSSRDVIM